MAQKKIIGSRDLVDMQTGEVWPCQVELVEKGKDYDFDKVWLQSYIASMDEINNKKAKVANFIIEHRNHENVYIGTYEKIAEETGICVTTINQAVKALINCDPPLLKRVSPGCLMINPEILYKGKRENRMGLIRRFVDEMPQVSTELEGQVVFGEENHEEHEENEKKAVNE